MFRLNDDFIDNYRNRQPEWGPLGYVIAKRTYCRRKENGETEEWWEVLRRVVEGEFEIQREHCAKNGIFFDEEKAQRSAQETYRLMWDFKFLPPGRGLWMMGTDFIKKHGSMALNNCGFISTLNIDEKPTRPFTWAMNALMLGVGIGFDLRGSGKLRVYSLVEDSGETYIIDDSREGWVESLKRLIEAYTVTGRKVRFDFSKIRAKGEPIKGFGGVASGPDPLKEMLNSIEDIFKNRMGKTLRSLDILDIFNNIGKCVVAGNVRRSAQIALGMYNDEDFINAKTDPEKIKDLRWASNNSVFGVIGMDYTNIIPLIEKNGEPGIIYLDNIRKYGRMADPPNYVDRDVMGVNPCIAGFDRLLCKTDDDDEFKYRRLDSLVNKDLIIKSPFGDSYKGKVFYTGKKPTYRIRWKNSYKIDDIVATEDHRFMLVDGSACETIDLIGKRVRIGGYQRKEFVYKDMMLGRKNKRITIEGHDVASILRGRFGRMADIDSRNNIIYKAPNADEAYYVKQLLMEYFGIRSRVFCEKLQKDGEIYPVYKINISGFIDVNKFYMEIGFYNKKNEQLEETIKILTPPVYKVDYYGVVDVYDFNMEFNHWGIINGVVAHNCGEQALEDGELCTLVETFPSLHDSLYDYLNTLKYAYLYAKTVTLTNTQDAETNRVMNKNRRMGISQTGIIDAFVKHGRSEMLRWCDEGYKYIKQLDEKYSREWLSVPTSIKITSVKPSGSVSLLPGVSPGIHYPHAEYYIRRVRFASNHEILDVLRESGYNIYKDPYDDSGNTYVVDFPVHEKYFKKAKADVSIWEQMMNVIDYQRYWSDNQVSVTITFKPEEKGELGSLLESVEGKVKAVTMLPLFDHNYPAAPYETITKEKYDEMKASITPIFKTIHTDADGEKGCSTDMCSLKFEIGEIKHEI